jgi:hypothetical protein
MALLCEEAENVQRFDVTIHLVKICHLFIYRFLLSDINFK